MLFKAEVKVMLKEKVLDPQGAAVERALASHGNEAISSVRIGKVIELTLEGVDQKSVEAKVAAWADSFLANPIMENYTVSVVPQL